jgi:lipoprotein-releasing system ATP-binding protein
MIACQNLTFAYNSTKQFTFPDLQCPDRQTLLILGQSGRGKTTLLHLMALLLRPQSGQIFINEQDIAPLSGAQAAALRASQIGLVYQRPHFVASLSVLDNLLLANYLANQKNQKQRAGQLAEELGFAEHLSKKTNQLSQGEQQRVSIARALMNTPNVILADEPTSSLDDENCENVVKLLQRQSAQIGASLIIVTHDQRLKDVFANQIKL